MMGSAHSTAFGIDLSLIKENRFDMVLQYTLPMQLGLPHTFLVKKTPDVYFVVVLHSYLCLVRMPVDKKEALVSNNAKGPQMETFFYMFIFSICYL